MSRTHPVDALTAVARQFGPAHAERKLRLLRAIEKIAKLSPRQLVRLHDALYFLLAYPDNPRILLAVRKGIVALRRAVEAYTADNPLHTGFLNTGLPGSTNAYVYSYAVVQRLVELHPGALDVDWEAEFDDGALARALLLTLARSEMRGMEDGHVSVEEWLERNRTRAAETDLEAVVRMFRTSSLMPEQQKYAFEACDVRMTYLLRDPGSGRCEIVTRAKRTTFQRRPVPRETFPLRSRIVRPPKSYRRLSPGAGRGRIDLSLKALCSRNLEIYPLTYANPADVALVECGRGLQVLLAAMLPRFREVPESLLFFLLLKNGVPVAYGPASIFLGACEMGMNLFPEFRGGEVRFFYAQLMRSLYHLAGVRYFFIPAYGMGEGNPEALRTGAFWFYRKLGFRATEPGIEALARKHDAVLRRNPRHRFPMTTLRRLSHTEAHFDLSGGRSRPVHLSNLALAVSRHVAEHFGGDRDRAQRAGGRRKARDLGATDYATWDGDKKMALEQLAPVLALIPDLKDWPARDRRALLRAIRARGTRNELAYARGVAAHPRFAAAIRTLSPPDR